MFENRATGKITIFEVPNVPLALFLAAALIQRAFHPRHDWGTLVSAIGSGALAWWALAEITRGVNPFRRILGGVVLTALLAGLALR
jgi:hypothetical protein